VKSLRPPARARWLLRFPVLMLKSLRPPARARWLLRFRVLMLKGGVSASLNLVISVAGALLRKRVTPALRLRSLTDEERLKEHVVAPFRLRETGFLH